MDVCVFGRVRFTSTPKMHVASRKYRRRCRAPLLLRRISGIVLFVAVLILTESNWLPLLPWILPVPSWVPSYFTPLLGVPKITPQRWYSQFGQDKWVVSGQCHCRNLNNYSCVLNKAIPPVRTKGFFVELGAYDGVKNSNTKALEDSFSWHGVCIEPDPLNFRLLSYYRPRCRRRNVLVSSVGESHETFVSAGIMGGIFGGMGGTTGIQRLQSSRMSERSISVTMPTFNLTSVLDDVDAPRTIDYLSLDVEGNELGVLAGLDHSKYVFRRVTVEHNFQESARFQVAEFLSLQGYVRVATGSPNNCEISKQGTCMSDGETFCPCVDDFYLHSSELRCEGGLKDV